MEDNRHAAMGVGGMEVTTTEVFTMPKEQKKDFYLKMAYLMKPLTCTPARTEHELLCMLHKELKSVLSAIIPISTQPWGMPFSKIQKTITPYLIANNVDQKKRVSINNDLNAHMQLLTQIDANMAQIRRLVTIYNRFYKDVESLIGQNE